MMKLQRAISLAAAALLVAAPAAADNTGDTAGSSRASAAGVVAGGLAGALLGGPPGAIAGLALGGFTAEQVHQARRVPELASALEDARARTADLEEGRAGLVARIESLEASLALARAMQSAVPEPAELADGLGFALPFRTGSSQLPEDAAGGLEALAMLMEAAPDLVIRLDGHADARGPAPYNVALSLARARAVRRALVDLGVDGDRILLAGHGETKAAGTDPDAWALERRVDLTLALEADRLAARP